ncbi:MAG TPA: hypothetical protein VGU20_07935 [Stellaceae bacterium]|nr:hypothetical protein [Stellaceae bacterium]
MAANGQVQAAAAPPECGCPQEGGCLHLRALAQIEEIAGFGHAARVYAAQAALCRGGACCGEAASVSERAVAPPPVPLECRQSARPNSARPRGRSADLIYFDRRAVLDFVSDRAGNYVERRALKLETLPSRGDALGYLFGYWRDLRAASACRFTNIDTVHLDRAGIIGKMHVVDVSSSDPGDFRYELFGHAVPVDHCAVPRRLSIGIWADCLLRDYNTVRLTAAPQLRRMRCLLGGINYHYTRLILPFLDARDRVTRLAIAIRREPGDGVHVEAAQ